MSDIGNVVGQSGMPVEWFDRIPHQPGSVYELSEFQILPNVVKTVSGKTVVFGLADQEYLNSKVGGKSVEVLADGARFNQAGDRVTVIPPYAMAVRFAMRYPSCGDPVISGKPRFEYGI